MHSFQTPRIKRQEQQQKQNLNQLKAVKMETLNKKKTKYKTPKK